MYDYDVAISFANEDRKFAYQLATRLNEKYKVKVFYDDYEQAKLVGSNLYEYLIDIHNAKARFCVIIVSKHYKEKRWTRHEWRAAQSRALKQPDEKYIIPVRMDLSDLPGLLDTVGYLSAIKLTIKKIADIIFNVIKDEVSKQNIIRKAADKYSKGKFQETLELLNDDIFNDSIDALRIRADSYGNLHDYKNAIKELNTILKNLPEDFLSNFLLGIFNYRIGNFKKSVLHYKRAQKVFPDHPTIKSDLPEAIKKLKKSKAKE